MSKEIILEPDIMIVSETNEKGEILYANDDFCKIAGYTKDELIGKPHNLVRHKDMPKIAFKDLWDTVKSGKTWNGMVKNRCKNGDFYWVNATAYMVTKSNGVRKILSVRQKPTKDEILNAEILYKELRRGE